MSKFASAATIVNKLWPAHVQALNISYGKSAQAKLDIYGKKSKELKPVIMFWHGGSWKSGSKDYYRFVADYMERLGAIPIIVGYPLSPEQTFPGFIDDARSAVEWTRDNIQEYGGDPDRIYVMGHSAGAHLAVIATLQDKGQIAGCIALSTPINISRSYYKDVFGEKTFKKGLEKPTSHIGDNKHRFLLVHGKTDRIVAHKTSVFLEQELREADNEVILITLRYMGHMRLLATLMRPFAYRYIVGRRIKAFIV